tara:strand:+ start:7499 stop:13438 length:5940 start_codon:yes stop_codon:yes gene_type:complete
MEDLGKSVESSGNIQQRIIEKNRFIPQKNYADPANFAKFGSAEKYYSDSFDRIINQYPYDGSLRERTEFFNKSTYLDLYIYDNIYPRTTGYAIISPNGWGDVDSSITSGSTTIGLPNIVEYIQIVGGPHTASSGMIGKELSETFENSNFYNPDKNRESNLKFDFNQGVTIETWIKKEALIPTASSDVEYLFHLTNDETGTDTSGSLQIFFSSSNSGASDTPLVASFVSGTISDTYIYSGITTSELIDNNWHHVAISFQNSGSDAVSKAYLDGQLRDTTSSAGNAIGEVTGSLIANLGATRPFSYGGFIGVPEGSAKLSGSIDEFRYWKTARTSEEIGRYWFVQYGGGTNDDDANTDLGVYLKFNEGITGVAATDSIALDYSGRISNGTWVGYSSEARSTSSAIDLYLGKESEFKDPIIYSFNPSVVSTRASLEGSGSYYDLRNNASFYYSMPTWIIEEDDESGQELLKLSQILSSYFDTLYLQIENYPKLKDISYPGNKTKPLPFAYKLLEGLGLSTSEIFVDATILEQISNRNEDMKFDTELTDIKNLIYKNIYNNLTYIYKSKGNMKSFRNLMRCYGIDTDLVKINLYGDNSMYRFRDNYEVNSTRKKYIDFNNPYRFEGSIYQHDAGLGSDSRSFISASAVIGGEASTSFTLESEVIFQKKLSESHPDYFPTNFITSSLFGFHTAGPIAGDFTWPSDDWNIQVYAIREALESDNVYFQLDYSSSIGGAGQLTSSLFYDVYNNDKWNFALKFSPDVYGLSLVSGTASPNRILELYGVNSDAGAVANEFTLTETLTSADRTGFIDESKRIYAGSHRTNFTGSALNSTDIKLGSVRYWTSYLDNEVIKTHARDPENFGVLSPGKSTYLYPTSLSGVLVPQMETLALNWAFDTLTGSNANGQFAVQDLSSGSAEKRSLYGWMGEVVGMRHPGRGDFFPTDSSKVLDTKFVYSGKQTIPENIQSSDMVNLNESDSVFELTTRPVEYFFAIEKSMYQNISEEILNVFATIVDFNTLIGDPVNRYRQEYKQLAKLRQLFFERVQNEPDLDRYIDFYKWIDNSLSDFLNQLIPASAKFSDKMRTIVESHVLERNKYWTKFPTLDFETPDLETGIKGINELRYNWEKGHHPLNDDQGENCFWWKNRAEREGGTYSTNISSGDADVDENRNAYLSASLQTLDRSYSSPLNFNMQQQKIIDGGSNFYENKIIDYAKNTIPWLDDGAGGTTGIYITSGNVEPYTCNDLKSPPEKRKLKYGAYTTTAGFSNFPNPYNSTSGKGDKFTPFSIYSASNPPEYASDIITALGHNLDITNNHDDSYGSPIGVPMQGPFTEKFVGGLQVRHIDLNNGTDDFSTRPEAYRLRTSTGVLKIARQPFNRPRAMLYRDQIAKRPVNIRNIKQVNDTGTKFVSGTLVSNIGNYTKDYEVVQAAGGRTTNNRKWVQSGPWSLTDYDSITTSSAPFVVSLAVPDMIETSKIDRGRTEYVIVNRFSCPGGPDTMGDSNGGPGLDRFAAEFSPNNDINWRNNEVRNPLRKYMLTPHVNQFGYYSGVPNLGISGSTANPINYDGTGSFYQINRNTRTVLKQQLDGTVLTSSVYDNYYVQHPIPATDLRYAWITSSVESITPYSFGYWPRNFYVPSKTDAYISPINFVSASAQSYSIPVDFVGMNNLVYEPIPARYTFALRSNTLFPAWNVEDQLEAEAFNYDDITNYKNDEITTVPAVDMLNVLNLHRNGPYQSPAWKQSRTGQHPISRYLRRSNFIGCTQNKYAIVSIHGQASSSQQSLVEETKTTFYYEPAVSIMSVPLTFNLATAPTESHECGPDENGDGIGDSSIPDFKSDHPDNEAELALTYVNLGASIIGTYNFINIDLYNCSQGVEIDNIMGSSSPDTAALWYTPPTQQSEKFKNSCLSVDTPYGVVTSMYLRGGLENKSSPVSGFTELIYEAPIYPSPQNKFAKTSRERTNYLNTFWKNSRVERTALGASKFNGDD